MGWWKVEGTENLIGDGPLDSLGAAVEEVVALYQDEHGRPPTRDEWHQLLLGVLGAKELSPFAEGRVAETIAIKLKPP